MPRIAESRTLPWSAAQMFDLVADVRRYPEFLPWVIALRVRSASETELLADMVVGFSALRETFTSRVNLDRPNTIRVEYVDGPLRNLDNRWAFADLPGGGCRIDFTVEFAFRNALFERLAGQHIDRAFRKMVSAFEKRAALLYDGTQVSTPG